MRTKSLTFRSKVIRLKHREQLLHLLSQSGEMLSLSRDLLSQSSVIVQKVNELQQMSHDIAHEEDSDRAD